jgi:3-oxoacyl-[acyl-carrier protein] reductase|tara:strand:- start:183 stop:929 length:747 start_codon:yes stop_codon:yes gene_type:complete
MLLKNKVAVITGSNRGIGKQTLEIFSKNGADIIACVRESNNDFKEYTKKISQDTKNSIDIVDLDLQSENSVKDAIKRIASMNKKIDILINNAGSIYTGIFQMTPISKLREIFEINFFSQSVFVQGLVKTMIKNKSGNIIYISSSSAIDANEGRSAYSASKAAIITQAKTLSKELGVFNIRVNCIAPGLTQTDMMKNNTPDNILQEVIKTIPLKRVGDPNEIANVALFLASDLSTYLSGQTIRVDGGMN